MTVLPTRRTGRIRSGCGRAFAAVAVLAVAAPAVTVLAAPPARAAYVTSSEADLVAGLLPTVVNITTLKPPPPNAKAPKTAGEMMPPLHKSLGSGFIIDASGIIVTNRHVIENAREISVTLNDGTVLSATVLSQARDADVALLKVHPAQPLPTVTFGDSSEMRPGDPVIAIGNPIGFSSSVSAGIVSALARDIQSSPYDSYIQTDAAINHGNSGGPLFNLKGEVIGMNTALLVTTDMGGSIGVGFAIPSNDVEFVVGRLEKWGEVRPGWIGAYAQKVTPQLADAIGLVHPSGVIVTGIVPGSPAAAAQLREGDIILKVEGTDIGDLRRFNRAIGRQPIGSTTNIVLWRNQGYVIDPVTIAENPKDMAEPAGMPAAMAAAMPPRPADMGLTLGAVDGKIRAAHPLLTPGDGVAIAAVAAGSEAAAKGIAAGEVVDHVQHSGVGSPAQFWEQVNAARAAGREHVAMLVDGAGGHRWVALRIAPAPQP
ncbi:MAG: trypsin-like peptidase domain-containing protein [Rhodospirillales bacterium]|nr:trypsin-like peptidase domain-containing protein [Rhodospirillales bacterium]MDE2199157.1 trypsin-like peptidase domain-containing protein [Rhodospirillales bacterium]MDE2575378.1 trypsin-like peptidase domain-containing protein [Rhodospirillales bacterium]